MSKKGMIELTNYDDGKSTFIVPDAIVEIHEIPASDDYEARTRVITKANMIYLVKESAEYIRNAMFNLPDVIPEQIVN